MNITDLPGRMAAKVTIDGDCWIWGGALNSRGYGSVTDGKGSSMLAHRRAYEALVGPIPAGLTIDHLCRVKACVKPEHMEPVTVGENVRRALRVQSHCKHGHALESGNVRMQTRADGNTYRVCRACAAAHNRRSRARRGAFVSEAVAA